MREETYEFLTWILEEGVPNEDGGSNEIGCSGSGL